MMSREEARAFKERWKLVNEKINDEIRHTPIAEKLQLLAVIFAASQTLGWTGNRSEEEVRERWRRLKEKSNACP